MAYYTIRVTDSDGNFSDVALQIIIQPSPIPIPLFSPVNRSDGLIVDNSNSIDGIGEITLGSIIDNSESIEPQLSEVITIDNSTTTSSTGGNQGGGSS